MAGAEPATHKPDPGAFDRKSLEKIETAYSQQNRIAATEEETIRFSCNVINIGDQILMHTAEGIANRICAAGYRVSELPLGEFVIRKGRRGEEFGTSLE